LFKEDRQDAQSQLFSDSVTDGVAAASRVSSAHQHFAIFMETDYLYASEREFPRTADFNLVAFPARAIAYIVGKAAF
jgi:hypothetical protein